MRPVGRGATVTLDEQIEYHLKDGRAPEFDKGQSGRVALARFLIERILDYDKRRPFTIVELGCGAGDVSGPYSGARFMVGNEYRRKNGYMSKMIETTAHIENEIEVVGADVTLAALEACQRRWPDMTFLLSPVEHLKPIKCDLLVMTEFLEHVVDPIGIVKAWMPLARWSIVGHPLDEPDPPIEPGHIWSYTREDWRRWFEIGGHNWIEEFRFPMAGWDAMILGHSITKGG